MPATLETSLLEVDFFLALTKWVLQLPGLEARPV